MARFREEDVLANRIAHSPLTTDEAKSLADAVYDSHLRAAVIETPPLGASTATIAADVLAALPSLFAPADQTAIQVLTARLTALVADVQPLLERRASEGHVRRCHGDLHLANIVLLEGTPTLFDAIEFDETLATTDTLYDLAFLLMDLDKRGQRLTANIVLNRYLWRTQDMSDLDGLAALPVFLALRAAIRAMVGAQKAALAGDELTEPRSYLGRSASYLQRQRPGARSGRWLVGVGQINTCSRACSVPRAGTRRAAFAQRS